ncbi:hypothetical protein B0O99DRAFT_87459 [Bisporella sp. PMI_857]|nr:hypothetical protein B0O99DRAFT_87459 [Bisporella sp. PMI_857]
MANDNTMPDFGAFSPTNPNPTADTEKEEACTGTENARTKKETTAAIKSFGEKEKAGVEDKIVIYQYSEEQNGLDMDEENDEDPAGRAWHENIRLRDEQSVVEKVEQELKERPVHCLVVVAGKQKSGMQIRMITKDNVYTVYGLMA